MAANRILLKNIEVTGLHWGAYAQHQPEAIPEVFRALFALYEAGRIRPVVFRAYPLDEAGQALADLGSRRTWGKVVLTPERAGRGRPPRGRRLPRRAGRR